MARELENLGPLAAECVANKTFQLALAAGDEGELANQIHSYMNFARTRALLDIDTGAAALLRRMWKAKERMQRERFQIRSTATDDWFAAVAEMDKWIHEHGEVK